MRAYISRVHRAEKQRNERNGLLGNLLFFGEEREISSDLDVDEAKKLYHLYGNGNCLKCKYFLYLLKYFSDFF